MAPRRLSCRACGTAPARDAELGYNGGPDGKTAIVVLGGPFCDTCFGTAAEHRVQLRELHEAMTGARMSAGTIDLALLRRVRELRRKEIAS